MTEFDFIAKHLASLAGAEGLGLKDDAAIWSPPAGYDLVLTKDTMVEGVHFPNGHYGADTAEKLLRVNLSDLAAKGATPYGYMLSLALPKHVGETWLAAFAKGLKETQDLFEITLFGGDTTRIDGPMVVTATCFGLVPKGQAVLRSGASIGDLIFVTGPIGDAVLGLKIVLGQEVIPAPSGEAIWEWEQAYYRPQPRIGFRKVLRKYASAALDISDGLIADAGHLAKASGLALSINIDAVPLSKQTQSWLKGHDDPRACIKTLVTGGDDYELLFTASPQDKDALMVAAKAVGISLTQIGEASQGDGVVCNDSSGAIITFDRAGYTHF